MGGGRGGLRRVNMYNWRSMWGWGSGRQWDNREVARRWGMGCGKSNGRSRKRGSDKAGDRRSRWWWWDRGEEAKTDG